MTTLYAESTTNSQEIAEVFAEDFSEAKIKAEEIIYDMDDMGIWPEGTTPVMSDEQGDSWQYTGVWEPL